MKHTLDDAIHAIVGEFASLRAVALSVSPDGVIAWCWSRKNKPEVVLEFATLDRAATMCLESLGASVNPRTLLLRAKDVSVAAWPLDDADDDHNSRRERLVMTAVFDGELQTSDVIGLGTRLRTHLRDTLNAARTQTCMQLRAELVAFGSESADPAHALRDLADAANLELHRLERLDQLSIEEQQQLLELLASYPRAT